MFCVDLDGVDVVGEDQAEAFASSSPWFHAVGARVAVASARCVVCVEPSGDWS